jgi:hypothetical protein
MTTDPFQQPPRELSWRRKLSYADQARLRAWLAAHPEAQIDWDTETELTELLDRLPDAPLASNFTARVLQAVERENLANDRARRWTRRFWRAGWLPRAAVAAVILSAGLLSYQAVEKNRQRRQIANSVRAVSDAVLVSKATSPPDPDILADYPAIQAWSGTTAIQVWSGATSVADDQLLLLLK